MSARPLTAAERQAKVQLYQHFLSSRLEKDLAAAADTVARLEQEAANYAQLRDNVNKLKQVNPSELTLLHALCPGVHIPARVPTPRRLHVHVGLGFHVECGWEEALQVAALRQSHVERQLAAAQEVLAKVRANVRLVSEGIRELRQVEG